MRDGTKDRTPEMFLPLQHTMRKEKSLRVAKDVVTEHHTYKLKTMDVVWRNSKNYEKYWSEKNKTKP